MRTGMHTVARLGMSLAFLALTILLLPGIIGGDGIGDELVNPAPGRGASTDPSKNRLYHLRFLRARLGRDVAGSALFHTPEMVVPLSAREFWGRSDQTEALREALNAKEIEPMPGVVVRSGASFEGGPHRFRTALGGELVDVLFRGEVLDHGWSRISLRAETNQGIELLDAAFRVSSGGTVALVLPLSASSEDALVIGVTPLKQGIEPNLGEVFYAGLDGVTNPELVSKVVPDYPESAKTEKVSGQIIMQAVIRVDGIPDGLVVLQMPQGGEWLAGSAVEAVSKWRYKPATRNGVPVDAYFTVIFEFYLSDEPPTAFNRNLPSEPMDQP